MLEKHKADGQWVQALLLLLYLPIYELFAMKSVFHFLFAFLMCSLVQAQAPRTTTAEYIARYRDIAIAEREAYGIPAAITMAQGILESENGNSELARNSNNHFGIKCKSEWTGEKYYHDDDAAQECFRKYARVEDSYRDHSLFLKGRKHYAFLFNLASTDYVGWARGLKQAGYATNPAYAELLIKIIETYQLYLLDHGQLAAKPGVVPSPPADSVPRPQVRVVRDSLPAFVRVSPPPPIHTPIIKDTIRRVVHAEDDFQDIVLGEGRRAARMNNGVHYILARKGDTYERLADEMVFLVRDLYHFNDVEKGYQPQPGEKVYIELKKEEAAVSFHTVVSGETMHSIAQHYGIRLRSLYARNRMKPGTEAEIGQRLWLQGYAPLY